MDQKLGKTTSFIKTLKVFINKCLVKKTSLAPDDQLSLAIKNYIAEN